MDVDGLKVRIIEDEKGVRSYLVDEEWALSKLPELAAQLDRLTLREGLPEKKMGMRAARLPESRDGRGGVMMILYPPAQLRDATIEQITQVLGAQAHSLIASMAREIHTSYTSDPVTDIADAQPSGRTQSPIRHMITNPQIFFLGACNTCGRLARLDVDQIDVIQAEATGGGNSDVLECRTRYDSGKDVVTCAGSMELIGMVRPFAEHRRDCDVAKPDADPYVRALCNCREPAPRPAKTFIVAKHPDMARELARTRGIPHFQFVKDPHTLRGLSGQKILIHSSAKSAALDSVTNTLHECSIEHVD